MQAIQVATADFYTVNCTGLVYRLFRAQAHTRLGIEKRHLESRERRPCHLDPAGRPRLFQISRLGNILCVDGSHQVLTLVGFVLVQEDAPVEVVVEAFEGFHAAGDLRRTQVRQLPNMVEALLQQATVFGAVGRIDKAPQLIGHLFNQLHRT